MSKKKIAPEPTPKIRIVLRQEPGPARKVCDNRLAQAMKKD